MSPADFDQLRLAYKKATDEWVDTIRAEEAFATPDHSMIAWEKWDAAHFQGTGRPRQNTRKAREAYKDALRGAEHRYLG